MVENNENGMVSLNVVQEMMKVQKEAILSCFNMIVENLSKKVDNIMCRADLRFSNFSKC